MIYLASPYTHPDPAVREARFRAACRQAAEMFRCGVPVFSPIAYSHAIAGHDLPLEWEFWERFDRAFLETCDAVWVLTLDGWRESRGVQAEIMLARQMGKPVVLVEPDALTDRTPVAVSRAGAGRSGGSTDATL
jgi:nucleoside 2-deoxyribosyltransferase